MVAFVDQGNKITKKQLVPIIKEKIFTLVVQTFYVVLFTLLLGFDNHPRQTVLSNNGTAEKPSVSS